MADFGLSEKALDLLRTTFAATPHVERVIVYGSRAMGNFRQGSDIDLVLEGSSLTWHDLLRLETVLDDLMLPWNIDLSLRSHIDNPALLEHIARVGKPLWIQNGIRNEQREKIHAS